MTSTESIKFRVLRIDPLAKVPITEHDIRKDAEDYAGVLHALRDLIDPADPWTLLEKVNISPLAGLPTNLIAIVDENGVNKGLSGNFRARWLYPYGQLYGPVLIAGVEFDPEEGYLWTGLPDEVTVESLKTALAV